MYSNARMPASQSRDHLILVASLMVTQTIGWGTTYSQIAVLAQSISTDIGTSRAVLFSGATVMYLGAAVTAPFAGRLADRYGGLKLLAPGSVAIAAGLALLSLSTGTLSYLLAWLVFGLVQHIALVTAAYTGLAQAMGAGAARSIATLTLATGLCSSIFWPLSEFGLRLVDWRTLCQLYALLTLLICLPIHWWLARRYGHWRAGEGDDAVPLAPAHIRSGSEREGFTLQTLIASGGALITVGFGITVIDIFQQLGATREAAVFAGSLIGIAFVVSRGLVTLWADRISPVQLAKIVYILLPLCFVPLLVCGLTGIALPGWLAAIVAFSFGLPAGIVGILRSTFPLYLFGSAGYGGILGRQARMTELASAVSPAGIAWLMAISVSGSVAALVAVGGVASMATWRIGRLIRTN